MLFASADTIPLETIVQSERSILGVALRPYRSFPLNKSTLSFVLGSSAETACQSEQLHSLTHLHGLTPTACLPD